jgi:hypothetical protein
MVREHNHFHDSTHEHPYLLTGEDGSTKKKEVR